MPPEAAYGRKGRVFVSVALTLELIGACGIMSILFMDNVNNLFPTFPRMYVAAIFVAIVLPTTWTTKLGLLSYVSIVGVISMFFLLFVLIYEGITEKSKNYGSLREPVETVRLKTWGSFVGGVKTCESPCNCMGFIRIYFARLNLFTSRTHVTHAPPSQHLTCLNNSPSDL